MIRIEKIDEPSSLKLYRGTGATYRELPIISPDTFKELKENLALEQQFVCCYCMGGIDTAPGKMTVEHLKCRDRNPNLQLEYSNLLGACIGGSGPKRMLHCNPRKGNLDISFNPADSSRDIEQDIYYDPSDGTIFSTDAKLNNDINEVLNLNVDKLKKARANIIISFMSTYSNEVGVTAKEWEERLNSWIPAHGQLPAYFGIVRFYVREKIKSLGGL